MQRQTRYTDNVLHTNEFYTQKLSNGENLYKEQFLQQFLHVGTFTQRNRYTEQLLHTDALEQTSGYTKKPLQREIYTQQNLLEQTNNFYTETLAGRETFTPSSFDTEKHIYKEKPLHRAAFKQRKHRATITQRNFRTDRAAFAHPTILTQNFYKHVFLHTNVLQRDFILHQEGFAQRFFLPTAVFTHRHLYT